jgi:hypothetical protein
MALAYVEFYVLNLPKKYSFWMILFPVGQREKKSCQTESASRLRFRLVIRKKTRDAIARLFPVDQPGKYEREPISSSLIIRYVLFAHQKNNWAKTAHKFITMFSKQNFPGCYNKHTVWYIYIYIYNTDWQNTVTNKCTIIIKFKIGYHH